MTTTMASLTWVLGSHKKKMDAKANKTKLVAMEDISSVPYAAAGEGPTNPFKNAIFHANLKKYYSIL